jgi:hypothetical protein
MNNKNNLKVGDKIFVEQAWEDETGNYHDEYAEIKAINEDTGELDLDFYNSPQVNESLKKSEFFANDYETMTHK